MLDLVFRNLTKDKTFKESFFRRILLVAVKETNLGDKVETSVNLVGPAKMRALNRKYRKQDVPTDVLSFPLFKGLGDIKAGGYNEVVLGDVFICPAYAKKKAKACDMPLRNYLAWTAVHGFLHLTGYDHERSRGEAEKMFSLEKKILSRLKIKHPVLDS